MKLMMQVSLERAVKVVALVNVPSQVAREVRVHARGQTLLVTGFGGVIEVGVSGPTQTIVQVEEAPYTEPLATRTYSPGQERDAAAFIRQELLRWAGIAVRSREGRVA